MSDWPIGYWPFVKFWCELNGRRLILYYLTLVPVWNHAQFMVQAQIEQRATRRFSLRLPLVVSNSQGGEISAVTRDISSRGICFYMDAPPAIDSDLQFTLTLPPEITLTGPIRVRCFARVVRVKEGSEGVGAAVAAVINRYEFLADRC